jgi:hypothetical protein
MPRALQRIKLTNASVREGMVYVAMDVKDLRNYQDPPRPIHARLGGIHEQPYNRYRGIQASPEQLTLSDALRDPEIATAADGSFSPFPQEEPDEHTDEDPYYGSEIFGQTEPEAHCDVPSPPSNAVHTTFSDGGSLSFTLVSTDEESGPEDNSPQEVLDYRLQRLRRMSRRHDMDDWEPPGPSWAYSRADGSTSHRHSARGPLPWIMPPRPRLSRRGHSPPAETSNQDRSQRSKPAQSAVDDPNVQAARFSIKRNKSRVTVKFDPPISGRYILLKLYAGKSNVDVQSVVVKGYAGPRFFPAMQML